MNAAALPAGPPSAPGARLEPVDWAAMQGWAAAAAAPAFEAFRRSCANPAPLRRGAEPPAALHAACAAALSLPEPDEAAAKAFFESWFTPLAIRPDDGAGFLTGYFEPEFPASRQPAPGFGTPLFARPPDLVTIDPAAPPAGWTGPLQAARREPSGDLAPFPTRREIDEGALGADAAIIAWMRDPVDRFVIQVQGSARLVLPDGSLMRVAYAGRNGHPYVSLGRLMSRRENIPPADMTMDRLVARLKAEPDANRAWIWENPSFVFFRHAAELDATQGPIGGAGLPLASGVSIAADRAIWPYGLPMWLDGEIPTAERGRTEKLRRLAIVQDTGSAIVGPARFDLFYGSGEAAGFLAGLTRHRVEATVLWPRAAAERR